MTKAKFETGGQTLELVLTTFSYYLSKVLETSFHTMLQEKIREGFKSTACISCALWT